MMQTCGATLWIMDRSSSGDVTSTDTQRFVFFSIMIDNRRFVRGFLVFEASDSYEAMVSWMKIVVG